MCTGKHYVATFLLGDTMFKHQPLVANIDEDVILGTDIMTQIEIILDLKRRVITIEREEVISPAAAKENFTTRVVLDKDTTFVE